MPIRPIFETEQPQPHILTNWFEQNWSEEELQLDKAPEGNSSECETILNKMLEGPKKGNDQVK